MKPVVVTGSLIPTFETITPQPVDVYTAEDIQKTGVKQHSPTHPAASGDLGQRQLGDSRGNGGDGSAQIGLRNIPNGTLVLINGRRWPRPIGLLADPGGVDINSIPLGAIERIEILKDGASAIYGADAVAGVINIIFKKNYNGVEMYGRYGNTTDSDVGEQDYYFILARRRQGLAADWRQLPREQCALQQRPRCFDGPSQQSNDFAAGTSGTGNPGRIGSGQTLRTRGRPPLAAFSTSARLARQPVRPVISGTSAVRPTDSYSQSLLLLMCLPALVHLWQWQLQNPG